MCGIFGVYGLDDVVFDLVAGLNVLQHRGQDAAGVVTFDGHMFHSKRGLGLVPQVFVESEYAHLKGKSGIGHVRYATQGSLQVSDAQPQFISYPFGISMAHNGNVTNFEELRLWLTSEKYRLIDTQNDLALILYTFACELEQRNLKDLKVTDIFDVTMAVQKRVLGAYSCLAEIAGHGFLAFTDPLGIRPLVMGQRYTDKGMVYAFASETICFDHLGFDFVKELKPGEIVYIDKHRKVHCHEPVLPTAKSAFCAFEYIYLAREDAQIRGASVASQRVRMGRLLAQAVRDAGIDPNVVIDVPTSGYFAAVGLAEELGVPYRRGFARNMHAVRSFILPKKHLRERVVRQKLNPIRDAVVGKRVAVVDDSIVRGTTACHLVRMLREAGAEKVFLISASPPVRHPCVYGIDMATKEEIIANHYDSHAIARYIGADAVIYQRIDDLVSLFRENSMCYACFTGEYPTAVSSAGLGQIAAEKVSSHRG